MKKLSQNLGICFLSCFTLIACGEYITKDKQSGKSTEVEGPKKKNKKKFLNFTPLEKNAEDKKGIKLSDLLNVGGDEIGSVNKYLWQASLEILNFLPLKSADPFSGIISFDKGSAPGSSQIYNATIYISDPALDVRSLNVSLRNSNGTVSSGVVREIENAILSRARQLRINALNL